MRALGCDARRSISRVRAAWAASQSLQPSRRCSTMTIATISGGMLRRPTSVIAEQLVGEEGEALPVEQGMDRVGTDP